ncbi:unnamed protein product [Blepharisma stoltei]|uniref:Uncharacterized protein n=1 Tax=Blepharisma stoltei TaxID=1481888 RepID=A0AAU9IU90_9CILI|nr:unnamed protein product [Blepharisma stoltei]
MRRNCKNGIYTSQTIKSCRCIACMSFIRLILDPNTWYTTNKIHMSLHNRSHQLCSNSYNLTKSIFVKMLHRDRKRLIPWDFRRYIKNRRREKRKIVKLKKKNVIWDMDDSLDYCSYAMKNGFIERGQFRL